MADGFALGCRRHHGNKGEADAEKRRRFKDITCSSDILIIPGSRCLLEVGEIPRGYSGRCTCLWGLLRREMRRRYGRAQLDTDQEIGVKKNCKGYQLRRGCSALSGIVPVSEWNSPAEPCLSVPACGLFAYSYERAF